MSDELKPKKSGKKTSPGVKGNHIAKRAAAYAAAISKKITPRVIIMMLYQMADNGLKSGRASGNVYQRNGRVRKMTVPTLVQNAYTSAARALLASFSQGWSALTQSQRDSWLNMTWLFRSNRFGVPFMVKGKDAYTMLNANLTNIGIAAIDTAPLNAGVSAPIIDIDITLDQSTPTMSVAFSPSPAENAALVYATPVMSPGVARPKKTAYRLIDVIAATNTTPYDGAIPYASKYGTSWKDDAGNVGGKIFFKLISIEQTTGARTGEIINYGEIVA